MRTINRARTGAQILFSGISFLAAAGGLARAEAKADESASPPMEHVVIFKEEGIYACFPEIFNKGGDTLVTRFSRRLSRSHVNFEGPGPLTMISTDGGLSWEPGGDGLDVMPEWETESGEWVRVTDKGWTETDASEKERLKAEGYSVRDVREGVVTYLPRKYIIKRSSDQGESWSEEVHDAPDYVKSLFHMFETHTYLVTSSGVRIRALYGSGDIFFLRSEDDWNTWEFFRLQPDGRGDVGFNESSLVELPDGRLLIMMRSQGGEGHLWQSYSEDAGKTWSEPERTAIRGYPGHLLVLPDGRLLCTYGYRWKPMGVRACVSRDNGKSWEVDKEIVLRDDGRHRGADIGYPTSTVLSDGSIFTIYYINLEDNITHVAGTRWKLE